MELGLNKGISPYSWLKNLKFCHLQNHYRPVGCVCLITILFSLWLLFHHCALSGCRTDGFTFESDLEVTTHPSQIMDFDEDAKRVGLLAFSLGEDLNGIHVWKEGSKGMFGAWKGRLTHIFMPSQCSICSPTFPRLSPWLYGTEFLVECQLRAGQVAWKVRNGIERKDKK